MVLTAIQKEKQREYFRKYYLKNKQKFSDFDKTRNDTYVKCDVCSKNKLTMVSLKRYTDHCKTIKHTTNLNTVDDKTDEPTKENELETIYSMVKKLQSMDPDNLAVLFS